MVFSKIFFGSEVTCFFVACKRWPQLHWMGQDGAGAEKVVQRRANPDYTSCDQFLTLSVWQNLQGGKSERQRAEVLADFLFHVLGLRLPSEQTYGKMTAVVAMFCGQMTRRDLHSGPKDRRPKILSQHGRTVVMRLPR